MPAPPSERPRPASSPPACRPERSEGSSTTLAGASPPGRPSPSHASTLPARPWLAALLLALALLAAYSNTLDAPFVFDDRPAILANPTLGSFATALSPPRDGGTVAGRPLLNLTFYLNRQISGTDPWSYHALNLLIHLLAALTLHALILRTLRSLNSQPSTLNAPAPLNPPTVAFATALLWSLHPVQTAAVTYTVQRAESLAALFILLSLYASTHTAQSRRPASPSAAPALLRLLRLLRPTLSVLFCLAGQATKETAVVTPLLILLYDRTFISGTFRSAVRIRPFFYAALAATWIVLAWLVLTNSARAGTAGFATGIHWLDYALTQCRALTIYLQLVFWPAPLVFDYGAPIDHSLATAWPFVLVAVAFLATTLLLVRRHRVALFLFATFVLLLAPTTSILPIATQTIAEHRLYLPLACFSLGLVLLLARCACRDCLLFTLPLALVLASLTFARNRDYASALTLWTDTAAKRPENARAHNNAGIELARVDRLSDAARHYELGLRHATRPDAELHHNYATILLQLSRPADAIEHFAHAVRLKPISFPSRLSLATALANANRPDEALAHFAAAEKLKALPADALGTQAALLAQTNQLPAAISRYRAALALTPDDARLHYNLGLALARSNKLPDAIAVWRDCLRHDARHLPARVNLANALLLSRRIDEAITEYEIALQLDPANATARQNLSRARSLR